MQTSESFAKVIRGAIYAFGAALLAFVLYDFTTPHQAVSAQNAGTVGIQAQMIPVFTAQTSNKSSAIFKDIGQGTNLLFYCTTNFIGSIDLEWTPSNSLAGTFYPITQASYANSDNNCHSLPFGSYFPNLRSTLTVSTGSISAWYTSISGPTAFAAPALGSAGPTSPVTCDQNITSGQIATGTTSLLAAPQNTGDAVVICGMTVNFAAAPSAGQVIIKYAASGACSPITQPIPSWEILTGSTTPLVVTVPYSIRNYNYAAQTPCLINGSGVNVLVSISFASVHLL
jgi:hypothetical protein